MKKKKNTKNQNFACFSIILSIFDKKNFPFDFKRQSEHSALLTDKVLRPFFLSIACDGKSFKKNVIFMFF